MDDLGNLYDAPPKAKNCLRTIQMNIDGIRSKKEQLALAVEHLQPDVIIVCETKLNKNVKNAEFMPPDYQTDVYRKDRNEDGGGVLLAFKDGLNATEIKIEHNAEAVWASIPLKNAPPLKICSFYRPPHSGAEPVNILNEITSTVNEKGNGNSNLIIAGDFNCKCIDWTVPNVKSGANEAEAHHQLLNLINDQTLTNIQRESTRYSNLLDLYLTTNPTVIKSHMTIPGISDHETILVDTELTPMLNKSPPRRSYLFHKANWEEIKEKTRTFSSDFHGDYQAKTVNENWSNLKDFLKSILTNDIPSKKRTRKSCLPWITNEILRLIKKKKRLYRKAKNRSKEKDWRIYNEMKKHTQREIKKSHANYLNETLTTHLEEGNMKPFWGYIKSRKKDSCGVAPLKQDGSILADSKGKAEALSRQFTSVFTRDTGDEIPTTGGERKPTIKPLTITAKGVEKLLKSVKATKAPGPDGIPNTLLNELASELTPPITTIFRQSLETGQIPNDWKKANITPVFKKDDRSTPANYRPVSLTCVCSKLMEHIIVSHMMNHLEEYGILTERQHGFRRRRSCLTQLHLTTTELAKHFNDNIQVDMCILDFSKAFDVVSHRKLIAKLEHYGIRNNILTWIQGFLQDREQSVVVDGVSSEPAPVLSGVPQGTCLGPALFLCYINDIIQSIGSEIRLFADDALLYRTIRTTEDQRAMQEDLDRLQTWANRWNMSFNPKKCYIMNMKRTGDKLTKYYSLQNEILKTVTDNPYLGILLNESLDYAGHINKICTKASRTIGFLNRNLKHAPPQLRNLAYITMCRSSLEYASPVWDPFLQKEVDQIERVQRKGARMVMRDFRQKASVTEMMAKLKWESLECRRKKARLTLLYQITNNELAIPKDDDLLEEGLRGRYKHLSHEHQGYKFSFYPRTIREWNKLPPNIKKSPNLTTFKAQLSKLAFD